MAEEFELRVVKKVPHARRPRSRATEGLERDLLFDEETGDTLGPSESTKATPQQAKEYYQENTPLTRRFLENEITQQVIDVGLDKFYQLIIDRGIPLAWGAGRKGMSKISSLVSESHSRPTTRQILESYKLENGQTSPESLVAEQNGAEDSSSTTHQGAELSSSRSEMTSDEYFSRQLIAYMAEQIAQEQRSLLKDARLVDGGDCDELKQQARKLVAESRVGLDESSFLKFLESAQNESIEIARTKDDRPGDTN